MRACGGGGGGGPSSSSGGVYAFEVAVTLFDATSGAFYGVTSRGVPVQPFVDAVSSGGSGAAAAAADGNAGGGATATASNAAADSAKQPEQQHSQQQQQRRLAARFAFDVFWRSRAHDADCTAIAEVCLVRRSGDGVAAERFSLGWAALPVATPAATAAATPPLAAAPVNSGTPRVLLMPRPAAAAGGGGGGGSSSGQPPQPVPIPGCGVTFSVCRWPAAEPALAALAPEDYLLSVHDAVPGLVRFGLDSLPTRRLARAISTLPAPLLVPTARVALAAARVRVPQQLHALLAALPSIFGSTKPQQLLPPSAAELLPVLAAPAPAGAVRYSLRVFAHNGRTVVGGGGGGGGAADEAAAARRKCYPLEPLPATGAILLQPFGGGDSGRGSDGGAAAAAIELAGVPMDTHVVLVLQLLAAPASEAANAHGRDASTTGAVVVGQALLCPFGPAHQQQQLALAAGLKRVELAGALPFSGGGPRGIVERALALASASLASAGSGSGGGDAAAAEALAASEPPPLLQWRALLGDVAERRLPDPVAEFELCHGDERAPSAAPRMVATSGGGEALPSGGAANVAITQPPPPPPPQQQQQQQHRHHHHSKQQHHHRHTQQHHQHAEPFYGNSSGGVSSSTTTLPAPPPRADELALAQLPAVVSRLAAAVEGLCEERSLLRASLSALRPSSAAAVGGGAGAPETAAAAAAEAAATAADAREHATKPAAAASAPRQASGVNAAAADRAAFAAGGAAIPSCLTSSEVTVQVVAYRAAALADAESSPSNGSSGSSGYVPKSVYFTAKFFDRAEATAGPAYLTGPLDSAAAGQPPGGGGGEGALHAVVPFAADAAAAPASVGFSWSVDGSQALQAAAQAAAAAGAQLTSPALLAAAAAGEAGALRRYMQTARLAVEAWDAESGLPLGTAHVSLAPLLHLSVDGSGAARTSMTADACVEQRLEAPVTVCDGVATRAQVAGSGGSLLLRLVHTDKQPSIAAVAAVSAAGAAASSPSSSPSIVRLRPALSEPSSPIAHELTAAAAAASPWYFGGRSGPGALAASGGGEESDLSSTHRRLDWTAEASAGSPGADANAADSAADSSARRQLLADVDAARQRQKAHAIRAQLRRRLGGGGSGQRLCTAVARPALGEPVLVTVPVDAAAAAVGGAASVVVVEAACTAEDASVELAPVRGAAELAALLACAPRAYGGGQLQQQQQQGALGLRVFAPAGAAGGAPAVASLAPGERALLPFALRLRACGGAGSQARIRLSAAGCPLAALDVAVVPRSAAVASQAVRFFAAEGELFRATLEPPSLPAAADASSQWHAACSDPSVAVAVEWPVAAAAVAPPRVAIQRKVGATASQQQPSHFYVWLYHGGDGSGTTAASWSVKLHAVRRASLAAPLGGASTAAVEAATALSAAAHAYSSAPTEFAPALLATPAAFDGSGAAHSGQQQQGGLLTVRFSPAAPGRRRALVSVVGSSSSSSGSGAVAAATAPPPPAASAATLLLVDGDARAPAATQAAEVFVAANGGGEGVATFTLQNPYAQARSFSLRAFAEPATVTASLDPPGPLFLQPGGSLRVRVCVSIAAAVAKGGRLLVLVHSGESGGGGGVAEECWHVNVRA